MAGPEPTDAALLAQVAEQDDQALRMLYERHAGWMSARLRRRCSDSEIVADVIQDTFVSVWKSARRYRGDSDVAGWVWGIAVHRLLSAVRSRGAHSPLLGPALSSRLEADPSAEDDVLLAVQYSDVGSALARISPELRVVLQATVLDGLTTREAAKLLGIPQGTVKTRLARARASMREELA
jgi:RNA polymerase sigma-70 factor (ECF subfamily)